jgi:hypothetical protein
VPHLSLSGSTITDDRANSHRAAAASLADRTSFRLGGPSFRIVEPEATADPAQQALLLGRRLLADESGFSRVMGSVLPVLALLCGIAGLVVIVVARSAGGRMWPVAGLLLFVALLLGYARGHDRQRRKRDLARLPLLPPVCLACGYDLTGLAPDPDGCTTCPECGAAWQLPAITSPSAT